VQQASGGSARSFRCGDDMLEDDIREVLFILFFSVLYGVKFFKVTTLVIVQVVDEEKSLDMLTKNG
jgi:hypothetical protein